MDVCTGFLLFFFWCNWVRYVHSPKNDYKIKRNAWTASYIINIPCNFALNSSHTQFFGFRNKKYIDWFNWNECDVRIWSQSRNILSTEVIWNINGKNISKSDSSNSLSTIFFSFYVSQSPYRLLFRLCNNKNIETICISGNSIHNNYNITELWWISLVTNCKWGATN